MHKKTIWKLKARSGGIRRKITKEYLKIVRQNNQFIATQPVNTSASENETIEMHSINDGSVHSVDENLSEPGSSKPISSTNSNQINDCSVNNIVEADYSDCSSSESEYNSNFINHLSFRKKIRTWAVENKISHVALNKLSVIINEVLPGTLPTDSRTILCTPKHVTLKNIEGGQYWHNGIASPLIAILENWLDVPDTISINFNLDGLPIFKSSSNEFWPILGNIFENPRIRPFVIGIYFGKGKPKNVNEYLEDFVNDMKILLEDGLRVQQLQKTIKIKIRCFICDSPARAFVKGAALWLAATTLQIFLLPISCGHNRRSMAQAGLPQSKGGWRPVIGSGGVIYGFGTAPLHAPAAYKFPLPAIDTYASSARPIVTRDAAKLTSIAQSYRPTTLRTVSPVPPTPPANQPINSYHNPFNLNNNGLTHYKYVQNFPVDSVLIRNPHNPFAARPVFTKYPNKFQHHHLQHLTKIHPIQFGQYPTNKPLDVFAKPIDVYKKPSSGTEIYKPEVYKLPDSDTASQSLNQQVKTAQQQGISGTTKIPISPYPQYPFQDSGLAPGILGTFGSFGIHSVKGRDPVFPSKTTYLPPQPTKQTIFNSFSYSPNYKLTTNQLPTTTPKLQTTANHVIHFGSAYDNYKNVPTQQTKVSAPLKTDPNGGNKVTFRPSPQDPFIKTYQNTDYKVSTYNPVAQTTTISNVFYHDYNYPSQQNAQIQNFYEQQNVNNDYLKKQKIQESFADANKQASLQQYVHSSNIKLEATQNTVPHRATYEVTENFDSEVTSATPVAWSVSPEGYDYNNQKSTEESVTKRVNHNSIGFGKQSTTSLPDGLDEYSIVTEAEKVYVNSLSNDNQDESQSRRPISDDFEPIGKHKLKDYYYKVTPSYGEQSTKRSKKPTETYKFSTESDVTTSFSVNKDTNNDIQIEVLPTLPPNKHFKRPAGQDTVDKEKIRKRIKNRRRRPPQSGPHHNREESSTRKYTQSSTEPVSTTEAEEVHTIKPRVRPVKVKSQSILTTPSITTDLTTSALPTISPTTPTIVKKKVAHRRPLSTTANTEIITEYLRDFDLNKESPIMKIASSARPNLPKFSSTPYEYNETPDYTHKQDEKDTPTSDIAVSLSDTFKSREPNKGFSFHRDVKPIDAKVDSTVTSPKETTTETFKEGTEVTNEFTTTTVRLETTPEGNKRSRTKNKFESNRPRFSVKDYRNRLSSTTSTTEKNGELNTPKIRFPQRRVPYHDNKFNSEVENTTERKKFTPKEPRHKPINGTEITEQTEKAIHSIRQTIRQRQNTVEATEGTTQRISARVRNGSRRPKPTEETTTQIPTTANNKRPLRKKNKETDIIKDSVQDISVTDTTPYDRRDETSERSWSESAIMKIADKKHHTHDNGFEHSKRVSDLTLAASKDYNTPGMFKTVSSSSRRIPNYFTIATDDPILPIEAFFPQLNQKKES